MARRTSHKCGEVRNESIHHNPKARFERSTSVVDDASTRLDGYERAWDALQGRGVSHRSIVAPFYARSTGPYRGETIALAQFSSLVSYGSTTSQFPMNGPAASHAIHWGWQCAAANYGLAGGYQTTMETGANYSAGWGRLLVFGASAQYSAGFGYSNNFNAPYTFAAGRGHTVADPYCAALGAFSEYTTPLADPPRLQVGCGTSASVAFNGLTVFASGRSVFGGNLELRRDNAYSVGTPSARVSVFYSATASINTSDARTKNVRGPLTDAELRAWAKVQPCVYQLLDAVARKGIDVARLHAGLIAQDVMAAFISEGLDPQRYALFCEDEIFEEVFEVQPFLVRRQKTAPGRAREIEIRDGKPVEVWGAVDDMLQFEDVEVVDEGGATVPDPLTGKPMMHPVPLMEEVEEEVRVPVRRSIGTRYGLRYTECLIFEAAYQRARVGRLEARVAALEK